MNLELSVTLRSVYEVSKLLLLGTHRSLGPSSTEMEYKIGIFFRANALPIRGFWGYKIALRPFAFRTTRTLQQLGAAFDGPDDTGIAQPIFLRDPDGH
jgi:hypothetical protein